MIAGALLQAASGGSLGTLFVNLTANSANLIRGMNQAQLSVAGSSKAMLASVGMLTAGVTAALGVVGVLSVREFAKWESSFAGIRKTIDLSEEGFQKLAQNLRDISKEAPVSVNELNRITELGGQLGISGVENLTKFTDTISKFTTATGVAGETAATSFARIANIMQEPIKNIDRMGSVVAQLGDASAATEGEILEFATRMAGAGKIAGLTTDQIFSIAAAFTSVGIEAEAGGTAVQTVLLEMNKEGKRGIGAFTDFMDNLARSGTAGSQVLEELGFNNVRTQRAFLSLAGAGGILNEQLRIGAKEWQVNNRLTEEAEKRYKTFESQIAITWNIIKDMMITIGAQLAPALKVLNTMLQEGMKDMDGFGSSFSNFATNVGPAFVSIIGVIGDAIWGWRLLIKQGEMSFLGFAAVVLSVFETLQVTIATVISGLVNNTVSKINLLITKVNKILPEAMKLERIEFHVEVDTSELETQAQAFRDSFTESLKEVDHMLAQGSFSSRLKAEYAKATAAVVEGNSKMVEDTSKLLSSMQQAVDLANDFKSAAEGVTALRAKTATGAINRMGEESGLFPAEGGRGRSTIGGTGDFGADQAMQVNEELKAAQDRLAILQSISDEEVGITAETQEKKKALLEAYNKEAQRLQFAQAQIILGTASQIFGDLASIAETYAGKQSGIYQAMFAVSKAFAIADAVVKIQQGVANALSLPWPANLVAVGSVIAAAAGIVSTISSTTMELSGKRAVGGSVSSGKSYLVGERGPEMFSPASAGNITPNSQLGGGVKVIIINQTDAQATVTEKSEGDEKVLEIMIRRVKNEIASEVRDGRGNVSKALETSFGLKRGAGS